MTPPLNHIEVITPAMSNKFTDLACAHMDMGEAYEACNMPLMMHHILCRMLADSICAERCRRKEFPA